MQKLQLSIPEPCHENWQHMTPTEQGRFCNACAKEVVDFSRMTDIQVLNYFSALTNQKVCGRALPEQLNRPISRLDTPKKKLFWYWNYIVMFFMFFGKGNAAKAQGDIRPVTEVSPVKANDIRGQMVAGEVGSRVVTGKVCDKDGNPVSFASIKIKGTNTGVSADANGAYSIKVQTNSVLIISAAGFETSEFSTGDQLKLMSVLEESKAAVREVVITAVLGGIRRVPIKESASRVITGKVTDIDGNPVSFASIKIKGTNTGIWADANGNYSFRVNDANSLQISAAGFKTIEVPVATKSVINSVLETSGVPDLGVVVISMNCFGDGYYGPLDRTKQVAILKIKDEETGKLLPNVSVMINNNSKTDTVFTDRKGMYKIKGIKDYSKYFIKLVADGYEPAEFTINSYDIKDRKKEWEVLLRKQKVEIVKSIIKIQTDKIPTVRIRCQSFAVGKSPLVIVDGIIKGDGTNVNPDDIEDISILQGPAAAALFGPDGENGAILITTKKQDYKNLDTLVIPASQITGRLVHTKITTATTYSNVMGSMVQGVTISAGIRDTIKTFVARMTGAIRVYPNPVQRGEQFNLALKLKQTGQYHLQIIDAAGRIVLQKELNSMTKEFTEKIIADARWSSGAYYISIFDNKNKLINKGDFIVR